MDCVHYGLIRFNNCSTLSLKRSECGSGRVTYITGRVGRVKKRLTKDNSGRPTMVVVGSS